VVGRYAPDATVKEPGSPPLSGRWIRRSLQAAVNDPAFRLTFSHDRIEVARSGDLAYSRGHYRVNLTDPASGQPTTQYGSYLTVWQKQANGRWMVIEDFMTPGPAPRPLM
jgi:ketosteroid isomerase-like protein